MKTSSIGMVCFALTLIGSQAQTASVNQSATKTPLPTLSEYRVVGRDAHQKVWQRETYETGPNGQAVTNVHRYMELATGLNYKDAQGQWQDAKEEITILPDGTAAATNGQHQTYFPGNIYSGVIELVTPDGRHLKSQPLGLSYDDGTNALMIAELTNSIGYVVGSNQVIYPNAFTGFKADLRYTYTKAGFEQDVILRQQPPTPESLGLNPNTAKLQVLTEFFSPPQPAIKSRKLAKQAELALEDQSLEFGQMQMGQGRAFLLGQKAKEAGALVAKQWVQLDGRQFLVEEVPVDAIVDGLAALPLTAMNSGSGKAIRMASRHPNLPPKRLVKNDLSKVMMLAKDEQPAVGYVLDYQTVNGSQTDYTFQGDTTYYISGFVSLNGTNIFEGGTVIKYAVNTSISIGSYSPLIFKTSPYLPAVFTAIDDNTVGEIISGSTGNPTNYYANPALTFSSSPGNLSNFRISYASQAFYLGYGSASISHCQMINCLQGIYYYSYPETLQNVLFANVVTDFNFGGSGGGPVISVQNTTFSGSSNLLNSFGGGTIVMTNCILANVTNIGVGSINGNRNGFYNSPTFGTSQVTNTFYPFQTVGSGSYYLTNGCAFTNVGTTSIDPTLLAGLQQRTTYPPMVYSNTTISVPTTLSPQAQRDTDVPDLGYHYDPLDYAFGGVDLTTNLTFAPGTAVGIFQNYGSSDLSGQPYAIALNNGANLNMAGTANQPVWMARTVAVQEGNKNWSTIGWMGLLSLNGSGTSPQPQLNGRFAKFSTLASMAGNFQDNWAYGTIHFSDSEMYVGNIASYRPSHYYTNCLFFRVNIAFWDQQDAASVSYQNCTFYNGFLALCRSSAQSPSFWNIKNTAFDGTCFLPNDNFNGDTNYTAFDYNAYNTNNLSWQTFPNPYPPSYGTLEVVGPHDLTNSISFNWQSSWLGNFYLPTNSPLINAGSTNANLLTLYHFTTQTNQFKEGNSQVDIGYHYVAVDGNGNPIDSNGDGIPDYLEDPNGNGITDSGEAPFGITIVNPINGAVIY